MNEKLKNFSDLSDEEKTAHYEMVEEEFSRACDVIERKTGYKTDLIFSPVISAAFLMFSNEVDLAIRRLGKKTIKANIIVPKPSDLED